MASSSLMLYPAMSLFPNLLFFLVLLVHEIQSRCPDSFHFHHCPDNVYDGQLPTAFFTNTSLHRDQGCGGPCELACDYDKQTTIQCTQIRYQVLYINPNNSTMVVKPPNWLPPPADMEFHPCKAYKVLNASFPGFRYVSLTTNVHTENETYLGCPYLQGDAYWDRDHHKACRDHYDDVDAIVYGPYAYGQLPPGKPLPEGCMQFFNYFLTYYPEDNNNKNQPSNNKGRLAPSLEIGLPILVILAGSSLLCLFLRRKKSSVNLNVEAFLRSYVTLAPQRYSYSDIKKMTTSFKEKLGQGGFGAVYKGTLVGGRLVAVKLLKQLKGDNGDEFINEVASMGRTNHVNIVTLLGFCFERNKRALVYEFMPNGSLEKFTKGAGDHNRGAQSLTWHTMFEISLGIARGLEYLHRGCQMRILHFDIKPHNILLDGNFRPKISDFGLAKLYPQDTQSKVSMSMARGTIGYIAPEVFCRNFGNVSHKSDVYSYGMMVLEVIGSRRRGNDGEEATNSDSYFPHWIYKQLDHEEEVDELARDEEKEVKRKLILVSLWCIQTVPSSRPLMSRVVQMLEASLETIEIPPMPTLASPPRSNLYPSGSDQSFTHTL